MGAGTLALSGMFKVDGHIITCTVAAGHNASEGAITGVLNAENLFIIEIIVAAIGRLPTGKR